MRNLFRLFDGTGRVHFRICSLNSCGCYLSQLSKRNVTTSEAIGSILTKFLKISDDVSERGQEFLDRWQHSTMKMNFTTSFRRLSLPELGTHTVYMAHETTATSNQSSVNSSTTERPTEDHLQHVFKSLNHSLPRFFSQPHDYTIYSPEIVFENNIRGLTTKGIFGYVQQLALVRIFGHLKFAHVKFEVLKISKHAEDGTVQVHWRIRGIQGMKIIFNPWKMRPWNLSQIYAEEANWHVGFSIFYISRDGKVFRHVCNKRTPDDDKVPS